MQALPQVINSLAYYVIDSLSVSISNQVLNQRELILQLTYAAIADSRNLTHFHDHGNDILDVGQISVDLAHDIIPKLEAGMTWNALGEVSGKATGALITTSSRSLLITHTRSCYAVTLSNLGPQRVAVTLWSEREKRNNDMTQRRNRSKCTVCALITFTLHSGITPVKRLTFTALSPSKTWLTMTLATELSIEEEEENY